MAANHSGLARKVGYSSLIEELGLEVIPNWHESWISETSVHRVETIGDFVKETYPHSRWPGESIGDHLEFALKYDGTNLSTLAKLFDVIDASRIKEYIESKPTGKYARRLWFLYEYLTGERLTLPDLKQGNYVDLLDQTAYYTNNKVQKVRRSRINNNLLGDSRFCPIVRRTDKLRDFETADLPERCKQVVQSYPQHLLKRALSYLYTKETKSSFEIERITPSANRTERFVALLQTAEREDFVEKEQLIKLQNQIVDPRFAESDYRDTQNYVGETIAWRQERVHFVSPKPEDVSELMDGLVAAHQCMSEGGVHPVVHAATVAYGFLYLHPFDDGNGRTHRFLIHNILASQQFTPKDFIFPVSAAMLKDPTAYDRSLESFSKPIMHLVEFVLDDEGRMTVENDTALWYRFIDMTVQTEALFSFVETTIETVLVDELRFLANYDQTKAKIQNVVDMPDRKIDLFIRLCLQNNGALSQRKKERFFDFLSSQELERMEEAVNTGYKDEIAELADENG